MEHRIAGLLNDARGSGISEAASEDVQHLIMDYFVGEVESDADDESDSESDDYTHTHTVTDDGSESDKEPDVEETMECSIDQDIEEIQPLVSVDSAMPMSPEEQETEEDRKVRKFSCGCKGVKAASTSSGACYLQFSPEKVKLSRKQWRSLGAQKDVGLMTLLMGQQVSSGDETQGNKRAAKERRKRWTAYSYDSKRVCRETFKFMLDISQNKLSAIQKHLKENGLSLRKKKSGGVKSNSRALSEEEKHKIQLFLRGYAEDYALALPGRMQSFANNETLLLPSAHTKQLVYDNYCKAARQLNYRLVGLSTFKKLWRKLLPNLVVARPMTDLCWVCQRNTRQLQRSAGLTMAEREQVFNQLSEHQAAYTRERSFYNHCVAAAKVTAAEMGITCLHKNIPNSRDISMHYSFDYAQQVHLPHSPMQPGPIYFLVPRKCGLFGINCEALPQQINYCIDEAVVVAKGSNAVISYIHHFFESYGFGEKHLTLHCDNCAGQNKNQFVLQYLAWRVMKGLHTTVSLNFMLPGHTKFAPDWCFGILKRAFRKAEVHCLKELADVVQHSTRAGINQAVLVGDEDGNVQVPTYDWQDFFKGFGKPFPGIKAKQHFELTAEDPGYVRACFSLGDVEWERKLVLDPAAQHLQMPAVMPPPGLSQQRKAYLYQNIRPFVAPDKQDILCPPPS